MLPAVGQGVLALEIRKDDARMAELLRPLHHEPTGLALAAERGFLAFWGGGCQLPAAALAEVEDGRLNLRALIAYPDGRLILNGLKTGPAGLTLTEAAALGSDLAAQLAANGGAERMRETVGP
jgi:hydroxymethylbilane synthase